LETSGAWLKAKSTILLATGNPGKIRELKAILKPLNLRLLTLADLEGKILEPEETGADFLANALIKARHYAQASGYPALADDSGLVVEALGGRPGVASARYGGQNIGDAARNQLLTREMADISDRRAKFQAVLALVGHGESYLAWAGELAGTIADKPVGEGGFGYDPIFLEPSSGLTLAQLTLEEKNRISHRAKAGQALAKDLAKVDAFLRDYEDK
jgi:XTP/dITP diphosphohydrolase